MSEAVTADETEDGLDFDAPDDPDATVVTTGDPARSMLTVLSALVDEAKLHVTPEGLSVKAIDPANVGLVDFEAPAPSFSGYECAEELVVGVPFNRLQTALSFARKRQDDPVRLDFFDTGERTRIRVAVLRPDQRVRRVVEFFGIKPSSIREEPDDPSLELPNHADPEIAPLRDAIEAFKYDSVWFSREGLVFVVGTQPTQNPELDGDSDIVETVSFPETAWADDQSDSAKGSLFNLDYLDDVLAALDGGKADRLHVRFGDELPAKIAGEWTDWGFSAEFMIAPRIGSDSQ